MLRVTRLTDYATVVLTVLASEPDRVWSAAELAERARLELPTVAKLLKPLAHGGLVASFRGTHGGYRLAHAPTEISLIAIVEAMEGKLGMTECSGEHSTCEHEKHCGLPTHWRRINDVIADALGAVTLADLVPAPAKAPPRKAIALRLAVPGG
jgi:FeS assembly SUF system regulator